MEILANNYALHLRTNLPTGESFNLNPVVLPIQNAAL